MTEPVRPQDRRRTVLSRPGFVTVTELGKGESPGLQTVRCAWCGRRFQPVPGPGRPRRYCRRSCRQRDYEARQRVKADGLADHELVVTRRAISQLDDLVYMLACAVEDVDNDLAGEHDPDDVARSLQWLLEAARPLAELSKANHLWGPA